MASLKKMARQPNASPSLQAAYVRLASPPTDAPDNAGILHDTLQTSSNT